MSLNKIFIPICLTLIKETYSTINDDFFILQYFILRNTTQIIGYSCNDAKENNDLIKEFNDKGIFAAINQLQVNVSIKPVLYSKFNRIGVFLDLRCHSDNATEYLFTKASYARLYDALHNWLIIGDDLGRSVELLNDTEYSMDTDLMLAIKDNEDLSEKFMLFDVFNHCKHRGGVLNVTFYGTWEWNLGFVVNLTQEKFIRRQNLNGLKLRFSCILANRPKGMDLHHYLLDTTIKQQDVHVKFSYALWLHMAEQFNFTILPEEVISLNQSNRQTPVIKKLAERTTEIGGTPGILTKERLPVATLVQIWPLRTCFLFRTMPSRHIKVNHFLKPLTLDSWYTMISITVLTIFVFSLSLVTRESNGIFDRYSDAFVTTIGCVCQQGSELAINHVPSRIAFLQTMIFSLLLYNYYSASIVSTRLSEPLEKINDSLNELGKLTDFTFGAEKTLYFNSYITRPDWEAQQFYNNRWMKIPDKEKFMAPYDGMKRVRKGFFAYHIDLNTAYPLIERLFDNQQTCQLTEVFLVKPTDTGVFMSRNGSFVELAKIGLYKMRENGLRSRQIKVWAAREPQCRSDILSMDPVTIYEAAPAFLLLSFGFLLSLVFCNIEKIVLWKIRHEFLFKRKFSVIYRKFSFKKNSLRKVK